MWLGHEKPLWFQMSREDMISGLSFWLSTAVQPTPPQYSLHAGTPPQQFILWDDLSSHTNPLREELPAAPL